MLAGPLELASAIDCDFKEIGISHPVSQIHFRAKWPARAEFVEYAAKDHGLRVFVHWEDSTRVDWNFEKKFINSVTEVGAEC